MKKKLTKKEFDYIYSKVPRLCVDLIVVKDKKVLLTRRSITPFKGFWHIPGGGVLFREKIDEGVQRIAKEELGITVKNQKFLGYIELMKDGIHRHSITLEFRCEIAKNGTPILLEQANKFHFFDKIPSKIVLSQKRFLKKNWKIILN